MNLSSVHAKKAAEANANVSKHQSLQVVMGSVQEQTHEYILIVLEGLAQCDKLLERVIVTVDLYSNSRYCCLSHH